MKRLPNFACWIIQLSLIGCILVQSFAILNRTEVFQIQTSDDPDRITKSLAILLIPGNPSILRQFSSEAHHNLHTNQNKGSTFSFFHIYGAAPKARLFACRFSRLPSEPPFAITSHVPGKGGDILAGDGGEPRPAYSSKERRSSLATRQVNQDTSTRASSSGQKQTTTQRRPRAV